MTRLMPPRRKMKNRHRINANVDKSLFDGAQRIAYARGLTITAVIEDALTRLIEETADKNSYRRNTK